MDECKQFLTYWHDQYKFYAETFYRNILIFFFLVANFKQWLWDYKMSYLKTDHWRVDSLENTQNRNTAEVLNCQNHTAYIILR